MRLPWSKEENPRSRARSALRCRTRRAPSLRRPRAKPRSLGRSLSAPPRLIAAANSPFPHASKECTALFPAAPSAAFLCNAAP
eukprot:3736894-Pyramimonas_sp.AAC.1